MSKTVEITTTDQFLALLSSSTVVIADFYADWCGPCNAIAPIFEELSKRHSSPGKVTFVRVDVDQQTEISGIFEVTAMPTFILYKDGEVAHRVRGANTKALEQQVAAVVRGIGNGDGASGATEASGSGETWLGAAAPRGYQDITEEIEIKSIDLLNRDNAFGLGKCLFDSKKPSGLSTSSKSEGGEAAVDWVESDTDEQLIIYMPFRSSVKIHTIHITSLPPSSDNDDDDEVPMRPKTIKLFTNRAHIIGFEEADDINPTQTCTIEPKDWDPKTGTAKVELRFVQFQRVSSLALYVVDGDGESEKVRIDRVRIMGETGEKRGMGKLEKFGDEPGE
ncbi:hypothetical protein FQN57_005699 [Myotisia sp. PD_48]|nr:hypothetical protein FQN57_005699 [Myotisia sp. PD_48]